MQIPLEVCDLDESDPCLGQSAGQEALPGEGAFTGLADPVQPQRFGGFIPEIHHPGQFILHPEREFVALDHAIDPRVGHSPLPDPREQARTHWAFQPVRRPASPRVHDPSWALNPIDLFVLAAMSSLAPAAALSIVLGILCGASWVNGYVVLQEHVEDEFRGRTFAALTVLSRLGLFLSLTAFPILAGIVGADHGIELLGWRIDLSGTRVALWLGGAMVLGASAITWRGLLRHRTTRPIALALVPRMKRPRGDGVFIAFEGIEGAEIGRAHV